MNVLYEETSLTPLRVAKTSGFLDWSAQPSLFKHYPDFLFRYNFGTVTALRLVELSRMITSTKEIGKKPYHQLSVPSAGNLHPVELYVQIRGVKGVLSGIYHVDAGQSDIVLIREIEKNGLEPSVGIKGSLRGMLFILTSVPFRTEWKYNERCIRYCYLDIGHQIGALHASMQLDKQKMTILSAFDKKTLNELMGFKKEEFVSAVAFCGEIQERAIIPFKQNLMYVAPTDYSELSSDLATNVEKCEIMQSSIGELSNKVREENILQRRSARYFDENTTFQVQELEELIAKIDDIPYPLSCHVILLKAREKRTGVYSNNKLVKEGEFTQQACKLLVNQKFVQNADLIFVISSKYFSSNTLMQSGAYIHNIYMEAEVKGFGCSGIGAFYDKKMRGFLDTEEYILYVCAVGTKKK